MFGTMKYLNRPIIAGVVALALAFPVLGQTDVENREVPEGAEEIPGVTELMLAAADQSAEAVEAIARALDPADRAAADANGNTALHWAAFFATDPGVLDVLLDAEVPVDVRNVQGLTAFEIMQGNNSLVGSEGYRRLLRAKLDNRR